MVKKLLILKKKTSLTLGLLFIAFVGISQTQTFTSNGTFTVPAGVTSVTVEVWGGGGKGGTRTMGTFVYSGGGGGGAYAKKTAVTVVSGTAYTVTVGTGSTTTAAGGDSWFIATTTILAKGGSSVADNSSTGANGVAKAHLSIFINQRYFEDEWSKA